MWGTFMVTFDFWREVNSHCILQAFLIQACQLAEFKRRHSPCRAAEYRKKVLCFVGVDFIMNVKL